MSGSDQDFKQSLSLTDATMLVAGSMIGSGIFIVSADVTRNLGSSGWMLLAWVLAGVLTLIAALSYGELAGMFPPAGGPAVVGRAMAADRQQGAMADDAHEPEHLRPPWRVRWRTG